MIRLQRNNVVKVVADEQKSALLQKQGFHIIEERMKKNDIFSCAICQKTYQTQRGLLSHKCKGGN